MMKRSYDNRISGWLTTAAVLLAAAVFLILTRHAPTSPMNPMETREAEASSMYIVTNQLIVDDYFLNDSPESAQDDSPEEEDEEQEEEPEQEEWQEQEVQDQMPEDEPAEGEPLPDIPQLAYSSSYQSLQALITKNEKRGAQDPTVEGENGDGAGDADAGNGEGNGSAEEPGESGSGIVLGDADTDMLFTTTIVDREVVTEPEYPFLIELTEQGKKLIVVNTSVEVNGHARVCDYSDSLTLADGTNRVKVTVRFRDREGSQYDASKSYTLYYYREGQFYLKVCDARTGIGIEDGDSLSTTESEMILAISAYHTSGGEVEIVTPTVRMNSSLLTESADGYYHGNLFLGGNKLSVVAGTETERVTCSADIEYRTEVFNATLTGRETANPGNGFTDTVTEDNFSQAHNLKWAADTQSFSFRISCSQITGREQITYIGFISSGVETNVTGRASSDGFIEVELEGYAQSSEYHTGNIITVEMLDSNGVPQTLTWVITYVRTHTPAEYAPLIDVSVADGETFYSNEIPVYINAWDYQGNELNIYQMDLRLNGSAASIPFTSIDGGRYVYTMYLEPGPNVLSVTVTDQQQYTKTETYTVTYSPESSEITVLLQVDAGVVGLSTFIDEQVFTDADITAAEFLTQRLEVYGFGADWSGKGSSLYLNRITRGGMADGWFLTEEQILNYQDEGLEVTEPESTDGLGDYDFTTLSGWMVFVNGENMGSGMGSIKLKNNDVVQILFTLDQGYDLGAY